MHDQQINLTQEAGAHPSCATPCLVWAIGSVWSEYYVKRLLRSSLRNLFTYSSHSMGIFSLVPRFDHQLWNETVSSLSTDLKLPVRKRYTQHSKKWTSGWGTGTPPVLPHRHNCFWGWQYRCSICLFFQEVPVQVVDNCLSLAVKVAIRRAWSKAMVHSENVCVWGKVAAMLPPPLTARMPRLWWGKPLYRKHALIFTSMVVWNKG